MKNDLQNTPIYFQDISAEMARMYHISHKFAAIIEVYSVRVGWVVVERVLFTFTTGVMPVATPC